MSWKHDESERERGILILQKILSNIIQWFINFGTEQRGENQ